MENASKALIIAGAILLSILIIAIGMYIYNSSQNSIATAGSQISAQDIESFNKQWEMYEGQQTGTNIKSLISKISANAQTNKEEASRLFSVYCECKKNNENVKGIKLQMDVGDLHTDVLNFMRNRIEPQHVYYVTIAQSEKTGLVSGIIILYSNNYSKGTEYACYRKWSKGEKFADDVVFCRAEDKTEFDNF